MGKALGNEAERNMGAATLHNNRVTSWFASSCAGDSPPNHEVKAAALVDRSLIDSGQISRRNKDTASLLISSGEVEGKEATRRHVMMGCWNTADMDVMLLSTTLSTDAGE